MKLLIAIINSFELDEIRNGIVEVGLVFSTHIRGN